MNKLTFEQLVEAFGKDEVIEILRDLYAERKKTLSDLQFQYEIRKRHYPRIFTDSYLDIKIQENELTYGIPARELEKRLKQTAAQYLKAIDKLDTPKDSLSEEDIRRAREFPIERLLTGRLRQIGTRTSTTCPFHEERTPSFVLYGDNHYHCYGCNAHGQNAIDFIMNIEKVDFPTAVRRLM